MKNLYLVHCVDTEGPLYESLDATFQRIKTIFNYDVEPTEENLRNLQACAVDLGGNEQAVANLVSEKRIRMNGDWQAIKRMLSVLDSDKFRRQLKTDDGSEWTFSWFCLDHVGFTGENPRRRDAGDHKIFDFYKTHVDLSKRSDIIQWHYHPLPYTGDYNGSGIAYLNSNNIWQILAKKIIERHWFPTAYRPGFHTERPDSHWFLEQWIPFDYGNQAVSGLDTDQPDLAEGRYGDWRRAPSDWSIYHPSHEDYQVPGACKRWIARCLNIEARLRVITDHDLIQAFRRADSGIPTLVAVTNHDFRDIVTETGSLIDRINHLKISFPEVKISCVDAITGMRTTLNLAVSRPNLLCEMIRESNLKYRLHVMAEGQIFGSQPFLAIKTLDSNYIWENFDYAGPNQWTFTFDENHIPPDVISKIGIAANSPYGVTEVCVTDMTTSKWHKTIHNLSS